MALVMVMLGISDAHWHQQAERTQRNLDALNAERMARIASICAGLSRQLFPNTEALHYVEAHYQCPIGGTVQSPDKPPVNLPPADTDSPPAVRVTATATVSMTATSRVLVPGRPTTTVVRQGPQVRTTTTVTCGPAVLGVRLPPACR